MGTFGTRAIEELRRAGIAHVVHEYEPPERHGRERDDRPAYGLDAAAAMGIDPGRICKTLVARVEGGTDAGRRPGADATLVLAVVPADRDLDLKRLADAVGGRRATLVEAVEAERATGYVIGGISPIGGRRRLPVLLDAAASTQPRIHVSAGRRGLQVELATADFIRVTGARVAPIARESGPTPGAAAVRVPSG